MHCTLTNIIMTGYQKRFVSLHFLAASSWDYSQVVKRCRDARLLEMRRTTLWDDVAFPLRRVCGSCSDAARASLSQSGDERSLRFFCWPAVSDSISVSLRSQESYQFASGLFSATASDWCQRSRRCGHGWIRSVVLASACRATQPVAVSHPCCSAISRHRWLSFVAWTSSERSLCP